MSDPTKVLINSMITYGNLQKIANTTTNLSEADRKKINTEITNLTPLVLKHIQNDQIPLFPEKVILNILKKLEALLQNIMKVDRSRASEYADLLENTIDCKSQIQKALDDRMSSSSGLQQPDASPTGDGTLAESSASHGPVPQQYEFASLESVEKKCLFCFCLFPPGKEVKKREPIHLWVGMGLIDEPVNCVAMLNNLVQKGFIVCTFGGNKIFKRYTMKEQVHSMVIKEMNIKFLQESNSFSIMCQNQQPQQNSQQQQQTMSQQQQQPSPSQQQKRHQLEQPSTSQEQQQEQLSASQNPQQEQQSTSQQAASKSKHLLKRMSFKPAGITLGQKKQDGKNDFGKLVLNKCEEDTFKYINVEPIISNKLKNDVKVFHLSSWFDNDKSSYIMVEAEALNALTRNIEQVAVLSLQGISGIVELPDTIYNLTNLKVLDLRGCPNLEFLPDGIQSLTKLTHLDLSECYLLDHIPEGVASLTELRVLKGFIVNAEDSKEGKRNKKKQRSTSSSDASFSQLQNLEKLIKLTIRSRRANFPSGDDFDTLCAMEELANLKITWVCNYKTDVSSVSESGRFPASLKKLELQATPDNTLPRLLKLISDDKQNSLQKLYIRGGRSWDLGMEMHCLPHVHTIRLRYLHELHVDWDEFRGLYPNLTRLEVFECPYFFFLPCDENGIWEVDKD